MKMLKNFPVIIFILFFSAILGATVYYAPGWGLMDDCQNLGRASAVLHSPSPVQEFLKNVWGDAIGWGIFRPVYHLWIITVYNLFARMPTAIYILMALINMCSLLIWGRVFCSFYNVKKENSQLGAYLFPLSFFLFTPFWNIFMYISLQEKFVVLFSALSFYFFKKSYEVASNRLVPFTFLFLILGLFSKPTTLCLALVYIVFALLDCLLFKIRPALSLVYLAISGILAVAYTTFTFKIQIHGQYTASYGHNLKPMILIGKILAANLIIKFLFLLGIVSVLFHIIKFILTKDKNDVFGVLLPLGLLGFLTLLMPWGYQSYLLCDLAPFVLGIFFPLYIWLIGRNTFSRCSVNAAFLVLISAVLIGLILPRISKMGEITKTEDFLKSRSLQYRHSRYLLLPPYSESAYALNGFTSEDIAYLADGKIDETFLTDKGNNYLLVNDQCSKIRMNGVRLAEEIYSNKTWQIYSLAIDKNYTGEFKPLFKNNLIQEIKTTLRNL